MRAFLQYLCENVYSNKRGNLLYAAPSQSLYKWTLLAVSTFRHESELLPAVQAWLISQRLLVKTEVPNPWGICDVVGCRLKPSMVNKRARMGQSRPLGSRLRWDILHQIPDQGKRSTTLRGLIAKFAGLLDEEVIAAEVEQLESSGFVVKKRGRLQRIGGWMPLHERLIAVELKLSRVQEVIDQAIENLQLTSESYVALPFEAARRAVGGRSIGRLKANGVGVLGVTGAKCVVLLPASSNGQTKDAVSQAHCVERFLWQASQAA